MKVCFYAEFDTYIIPGFDGYVTLGGTRDFNSVKTDVCRYAYRSIRERCENLLPSLRKAPTLEQKVGLRPYREGGGRVEVEKIPSGHRAVGVSQALRGFLFFFCYGMEIFLIMEMLFFFLNRLFIIMDMEDMEFVQHQVVQLSPIILLKIYTNCHPQNFEIKKYKI